MLIGKSIVYITVITNIPSCYHCVLCLKSVKWPILEAQGNNSDTLSLVHEEIQCKILHKVLCFISQGLKKKLLQMKKQKKKLNSKLKSKFKLFLHVPPKTNPHPPLPPKIYFCLQTYSPYLTIQSVKQGVTCSVSNSTTSMCLTSLTKIIALTTKCTLINLALFCSTEGHSIIFKLYKRKKTMQTL